MWFVLVNLEFMLILANNLYQVMSKTDKKRFLKDLFDLY